VQSLDTGNIKTFYYILEQGFPMQKEPWDILCPSTISVAQEHRNVKKGEKGVQDMGYMQDTDYNIQDTAYMPGCTIQVTETGYSLYTIEDAGH
jgi:hypothetical protein